MSGTQTFLLELHCEEIPARFLQSLTNDLIKWLNVSIQVWGLPELVVDPFKESIAEREQLRSRGTFTFPDWKGMYSPRKIAIAVVGMLTLQPDQTETKDGPPQRMCVDEAGKPTIQGQKFAEKWGVPFDQVRFEQSAGKKEPCAVVTITKAGRPTVDLLMEALPGLIAGLHVPKAMRWGTSEFEFVRPIRNILCLFGDQVVPITVDGVTATNTTWGHRLFHREHPAPVSIATPDAYEPALEAAGVVVSVEVRRKRIAEQLDQLAAEVNGCVVADAELLDTLAEIVEFPKIVRGDFPAIFLELPKEVLVTSLREHQKSFCIEDAKGELLPCFLAAANRPDDPSGFVKAGNEWVLKARLYDARFFFAEDLKHPLSDRLEKLQALTFQRDLGSYYDKTGRVVAITKALATRLSEDEAHINRALEAARMAKCDLRTLMVGEFPELQGIMGGEYLKHEGAHEEVWMAVREHYRPTGAENDIPSTRLGCLLSLCDKLDTVVGCFAVGLIPSGSKDPLALRRAGQGIVRILWEQGWPLSPADLISIALGIVGARATKPTTETTEALLAFFKDRVAYQLEWLQFSGRVRRATMGAAWTDLLDLKARCEVLKRVEADPSFDSLKESAKRIGNILKDETPVELFDNTVLVEPAEIDLYNRLIYLEIVFAGVHYQNQYQMICGHLAELSQPLEAFFNSVMVKCEDPSLRAARLSLLHRLRQAFLRVADFSLWQ